MKKVKEIEQNTTPKTSLDLKEKVHSLASKLPIWPQEYEEDANMDIRMKPQPFVKTPIK